MSPPPNQPRQQQAVTKRRPDLPDSSTASLVVALRIVRPPNRVLPVSLPVRRGAAGAQSGLQSLWDRQYWLIPWPDQGGGLGFAGHGNIAEAWEHQEASSPHDQHKLGSRRSLTRRLASCPFSVRSCSSSHHRGYLPSS